jgi:Asp/Glu/hydantoin racemase
MWMMHFTDVKGWRRLKILLINPNSSQQLTEELYRQAVLIASSSTSIDVFSPSCGPLSIENEEDAEESASCTLRELEDRPAVVDAMIVACYSDHPLVPILRHQWNKPVVGILKASLIIADALNKKPLIITSGDDWIEPLATYLKRTGRLGVVRAIHDNATNLFDGREHINRRVFEEVQDFLSESEYVLCLGCAALTGTENTLTSIPWIVIDGVKAAVKLLESGGDSWPT